MRGSGPAAGAPVAVVTLPSRGLPRYVQFSVAKSVQFSMARCVQFSVAIDKSSELFGEGGRSEMGGSYRMSLKEFIYTHFQVVSHNPRMKPFSRCDSTGPKTRKTSEWRRPAPQTP